MDAATSEKKADLGHALARTPAAVFTAGVALAAIFGQRIPMAAMLAAELTALAIAGVGFVKLGARRRKRLPYLIASHGSGGWHARLPEAWRQVLENEAPNALRPLVPPPARGV